MKAFLSLMFFKGVLLKDPESVLEEQGPNSRSARRIRFASVEDVTRLSDTVKAYVDEAIEIENAGRSVGPAPELVLAAELLRRLDQDPALRAAFEALTPGRQREYNLYFSGARQAKTRAARVEKYVRRILDGKGFRDRRLQTPVWRAVPGAVEDGTESSSKEPCHRRTLRRCYARCCPPDALTPSCSTVLAFTGRSTVLRPTPGPRPQSDTSSPGTCWWRNSSSWRK